MQSQFVAAFSSIPWIFEPTLTLILYRVTSEEGRVGQIERNFLHSHMKIELDFKLAYYLLDSIP